MLKLRILGGLTLLDDEGRPFEVQRKSLLFLSVVALAPTGGISRDRLAAFFWPESDQERAGNSLRQRLHVLRRELRCDELFTGQAELRLDPALISVDAVEFDAAIARGDLDQAIALYGGPLLDGGHVRDAPELERWIEDARQRYARRAVEVLTTAARRATHAGEIDRAITYWQRLAALDPADFAATYGLIDATAQSGDVSRALRQYRLHESLLRSEFGVAPDARLTELIERIQRQRSPSSSLGPALETPVNGRQAVDGGSEGVGALARDASPPGPDRVDAPAAQRIRRTLFGVAAVAVAASIFVVAKGLGDRAAPGNRATVAVVPFEEIGLDSSVTSIGLVAADWVTQGLVMANVPVVDSRTMLSMQRDSTASPAALDVSRRVGAATAVTGRVERVGDSLRFLARVIDVRTGTIQHVLPPVTASPSAVTVALEQLQQKVMGSLAMLRGDAIDPLVARATSAPTLQAYREFAIGLEELAHNRPREAYRRFRAAFREDSTFVKAAFYAAQHAGAAARDSLIEVLRARGSALTLADQAELDYLVASNQSDREAIWLAARRQVEVTGESGPTLFNLGYAAVVTNRYDEAIRAFARIDPKRTWMRNYVLYYRWPDYAFHMTGRFTDELALIAEARRRFPRHFELCLVELGAYAALGRAAEVQQHVRECAPLSDGEIELSEEQLLLLGAREFRAHGHDAQADRIFADLVRRAEASHAAGMYQAAGMGSMYYEAGQWHRALPYLREVLDTTSDGARPMRAGMLAIAAAHVGDTATLRACRSWLERQDDGKKVPVIMWRARVAAHEGRTREANALIRRAAGLHAQVMATFHDDPGFTPLRDAREFHRLMGQR